MQAKLICSDNLTSLREYSTCHYSNDSLICASKSGHGNIAERSIRVFAHMFSQDYIIDVASPTEHWMTHSLFHIIEEIDVLRLICWYQPTVY